MELVREVIPGAADALAQRVAALNHESVDHPMKDDAVVVGLGDALVGAWIGPLLGAFGEADEVLDGLRRLRVVEPNGEISLGSRELGVDRQRRLLVCALAIRRSR